ncbi:MAG: DUF1489 domain-containing protein [Rickettsiales bacterium]|nr:DUF1489 domain-containing protein [Rickettsiales bacterium]
MTIHLIKLSVGPESLSQLVAWQAERLAERAKKGQAAELVHITRQTPKRREELLAGGSIYWVIKGWLCARQRLIDLRPLTIDGVAHCGLIYAPEMIRVRPRQTRAFQGWRYLQAADAPPDLALSDIGEMDDALVKQLAEMGLV